MPRLSEYVGSCTADDLRDLELIAKARAHPGAPAVRAELEQMAGDLEFGGSASEAAGLALQLLAPGDADGGGK